MRKADSVGGVGARWARGVAALALVSAVFGLTSGDAAAQARARGSARAAASSIDVEAFRQRLASREVPAVMVALGELQKLGAEAAPLAGDIEAMLKRGSTVLITKGAIETLGAIGQASSSAVIRPYLQHRTAELRRAAVRALSKTKGAEAVAACREGLRSSDGQVRGFSAAGLGALGAADALPDLFLALEHNVTEAAASIGQLCGPADCDRFGALLGRVAFDVMTSGFDPLLFREKPLPEATLLKAIGRIRELGTPEAGKYLADVQSRWPASGSAKVKQAIDGAVASIPGALGGS